MLGRVMCPARGGLMVMMLAFFFFFCEFGVWNGRVAALCLLRKGYLWENVFDV